MTPEPLSQPLGALMRPVTSIGIEGSMSEAARRLREDETPILAVLDGGATVGAIHDASLLHALERGTQSTDSLREAMVVIPVLSIRASGAEALRCLSESHSSGGFVRDDNGNLVGLVTPSDLIASKRRPARPRSIGGMATPFGVYLTTGVFGVGVGPLALMSTGALLFTFIFLAPNIIAPLTDYMADHQAPKAVLELFTSLFSVLFVGICMRVLPLSGIHAAEHQVVNAIEQGEELDLESVRRMSRIHPRCGTNLAVGAAIYMGIGATDWTSEISLRLLIAAVVTALLWRKVGAFVQYWFTTKPPTDKQLMMGIRSGELLLKRYQTSSVRMPNLGQRLLSSGMPFVILGSVSTLCLAELVSRLLGGPDLIR